MISDESHPSMKIAMADLAHRLGLVMGRERHTLTKSFLDKLYGILKDHRTEHRQKGVDFPVMVAVVVPRLGIIEFKRADLELPSIRTSIVNFVRQYGPVGVTMEEVVFAFKAAYPDLKPDDIISEQEKAVKANERMLKRQEEFAKQIEQIDKENEGE